MEIFSLEDLLYDENIDTFHKRIIEVKEDILGLEELIKEEENPIIFSSLKSSRSKLNPFFLKTKKTKTNSFLFFSLSFFLTKKKRKSN
jgi:hypothetical protein